MVEKRNVFFNIATIQELRSLSLSKSNVFDGYQNAPSTKDVTHTRRGRILGREVFFKPEMKLTTTKEEFLSVKNNKSKFISAPIDKLKDYPNSIEVHQASNDADLLIVQTAMKSAINVDTVVVGEDTDLFILLLHHAKADDNNIYFTGEPKNGKSRKVWNIKIIKQSLWEIICNRILFWHAILGCDTTLRLFGVGKGLVLKKMNE